MKKILVTGAMGQIGTELVPYLRSLYSVDQVVASGRRIHEECLFLTAGPFELLDITKSEAIAAIIKKYNIGTIYHLASLLSATGEQDPQLLWKINMNGLVNILEAAREADCSVFFPSSIAVFGPDAPRIKTPQDALTRPTSIYGVSKVAGELLCDYYHLKYGLDIRGLRYPGVISNAALPGGGTTDYAVHIFYAALKSGHYTCFLKEDSSIDMIYMPDVLKGALKLMEADPGKLKHRNAFNVSSITVTPRQLAAEIRKQIPDFTIDYEIDPVRQAIADSWPDSLDDSVAREEWGWNPNYDLVAMTRDMLDVLSKKLQQE
ncbi:MAG: NAD-dependent epimerase/dehydratase family protein [Firmicutes bacterium]|nr:NAD-dependent epimerase/dehydratase family protein [Bacillota bacterium]